MTVVDDEVQICSTRLILAAVIYGLSRDVPQDNRLLEDVLELCHIVDRGACLMDSSFPLSDFLPSDFFEAMLLHGSVEMLNDALVDAVEVSVSQRS